MLAQILSFVDDHYSALMTVLFVMVIAIAYIFLRKCEAYQSQTPYYSASGEQGLDDVFAHNDSADIQEPSDMNVAPVFDEDVHDDNLINNLDGGNKDRDDQSLEAFNSVDQYEHFTSDPDFIVLK